VKPEISLRYEAERRQMIEQQLRRRGIHDERVLDAMLRVPRHKFVPSQYEAQAYGDHPIPIGEDQTISQPYIVALSLEALELFGTETVLEIGTGSGYQTALLSELAQRVYSIERYATLARKAGCVLNDLKVANVEVVIGDGSHGLAEHAPYQAILVSAAAPGIPRGLLEQLSLGGRMVVPVGAPEAQDLQLVRRQEHGILVEKLEGCRFVPLIGAEGY
jgi:protein-L-isoaspartate(D-aspartate) O-methyltransferase